MRKECTAWSHIQLMTSRSYRCSHASVSSQNGKCLVERARGQLGEELADALGDRAR